MANKILIILNTNNLHLKNSKNDIAFFFTLPNREFPMVINLPTNINYQVKSLKNFVPGIILL